MRAGPDYDALATALGPLAVRHYPLGPLTTYGVGGPAAVFVEADRVAADRERPGRALAFVMGGDGLHGDVLLRTNALFVPPKPNAADKTTSRRVDLA